MSDLHIKHHRLLTIDVTPRGRDVIHALVILSVGLALLGFAEALNAEELRMAAEARV